MDYFERTLKSARTFLSRWRGVRGEMRELTISHKTLRLVLSADDRPGNLVIHCLDPERITGPVRWAECDVTVDTTREDGNRGFVVKDDAAGLEIVCGALELAENVKRY